MKTFYKYLFIIFIGIVFCIAFTSTHNVQSVNDLAYVIGLGIDVGTTSKLKITFQFTRATSSSENTSGEASPSITESVEADSIDAAINLMNAYVSKEISLSHCKAIIFSEEFAKIGIRDEVYSLSNKVQIRPDCSVIVCSGSAENYIKSIEPTLENLISKFYDMLPQSSEYSGYTANVELGTFTNGILSQTRQSVAIWRKCS